ncbi:acyl-CoA dehydrogenase [Variovorax sp. H27-G14]|uniref:acyl-CoA dehydrogenase n=1 Tax=Variovorax sp. H27-G14 TaxID=3111914 RepID=UPI0038FC8018
MPDSSPGLASVDGLHTLAQRYGDALTLGHLVEAGVDRLPLPGAGHTLARWRVLASVAAHDLSLVKLFEGHTDALAILAELGGAPATEPHALWGTWCAEPPDARVTLDADEAGRISLSGTKAWCSGAATVTHAVVSCWNAAGEPCLAAVAIRQPGVRVTDEGWHAVGMAGSASVDVHFDNAQAVQIGQPGDYVRRPGFWQGGAGIAACWFGGALGIAQRVRRPGGAKPDAHRLAHLGAIDVALTPAAAMLREAAAWIDRHPRDNAQRVAMRVRLAVEQAATQVMHHAGRAVGAGPLCREPHFARAMADLPVFLRQSHAERDLAGLGQLALDDAAAATQDNEQDNKQKGPPSWTL